MENQNYSGVQAVAIQLGINDIFLFKEYDWSKYDSSEALGYINQMVSSILAYDSSIKIIINLPTTPNSNGTSFTETYGTTQLYWTYNRNIIRFAQELSEYFANNSSVTISASNCILDTKTQIRDGVHPTTEGYNELGQRLYEVLISIVKNNT
jgi:lysophospholipase L1-like esterase